MSEVRILSPRPVVPSRWRGFRRSRADQPWGRESGRRELRGGQLA